MISKITGKIKNTLKESRHSYTIGRFFLLVGIVIAYFLFVSYQYGAGQGFLITFLTWSFFLFCTPIADAGFLLAFPIRIIIGLRMLYSQIILWVAGLLMNLFVFINYIEIYQKTWILKLFYYIITQPFPYWGIILLSGAGTLLSIYFGDEAFDVVSHEKREKYHKHFKKYKLIFFVFIIALIIILYDFMLHELGINIPLL